ncbi:hypothetical protein FGK63_02120 [Ruegeria sediminis]|uniref:Uncharacterized protein n=1 Tax=Ruegeria sediminis TaxID=2583820 RepID=A0ABY2X3D4_9RHOB|nr:hypothetical protein [Ruegeria sediminis]TMV09890.1 hypothetical protein FGK63_02120 [Ruegeria sediminis]
MIDGKRTHRFSEIFAPWFQVAALTLAGLWAVFEFGVFEARKKYVLEIDVSASIGDPIGDGSEGSDYVPIRLSSVIQNTGNRGVSLLFAKAVLGEEQFYPPEEGPIFGIRDWSTTEHEAFRFAENIGERGFSHATAFELFSPYYWLDKNEKQKNEILFFANTENAYVFSYQVFYYAAQRCNGIYPFETCYEFRADTWERPEGEKCPGDNLWVGVTRLCVQYFRAVIADGARDWEEVGKDVLYREHNMIIYRRDGSLFNGHARL